jgi:hypothetical protein
MRLCFRPLLRSSAQAASVSSRIHCTTMILVFAAIFFGPQVAPAQESTEDDHGAVIFEVGGAGEGSIHGAGLNFGPNLAAEITPIEDWLEIEAGVSALTTTGHTELSGDLVFKKPFQLTSTAELMIGLGPSVSHVLSGPDRGYSHGIEVVFDFMFWPHKDRGWYLEPSWSRIAGSRDQTIGLTAGFLFGWH